MIAVTRALPQRLVRYASALNGSYEHVLLVEKRLGDTSPP